jgi:hypothetical protein
MGLVIKGINTTERTDLHGKKYNMHFVRYRLEGIGSGVLFIRQDEYTMEELERLARIDQEKKKKDRADPVGVLK